MAANVLPSFDAFTSVFGVSATVRRPNESAAIATTVIWLPPVARTDLPGTEMGRSAPLQVLAIPTADVDRVPVGTIVVASAASGGASRTWRVERLLDAVEHDHIRVTVTLARTEG